MDPQNRAQCNEIVQKFTELHKTCSEDRQYCTRRLKTAPTRSRTDLSLLSPEALDFTPQMDKQINRSSLPVYNGPLATNSEAPGSTSFAENPGKTSTRNSFFSGMLHNEPDGIDKVTGFRMSNSTATVPLSHSAVNTVGASSSHVETQIPRPQSPNRRVRFQGKTGAMQGLPETPAEHGAYIDAQKVGVGPSSPTSHDASNPSLPLVPPSITESHKPPPNLPEEPELIAPPVLPNSRIVQQKSPIDKTPTVETPATAKGSDEDSNADSNNTIEPKKRSVGLRGFFHRLCCLSSSY
jgi:hypothetical protein